MIFPGYFVINDLSLVINKILMERRIYFLLDNSIVTISGEMEIRILILLIKEVT